MSLTCLGTGKEGECNPPPLSLAEFFSLCPLSDQHSWRTHHLRPWVTASATRIKKCKWDVAENSPDFMVGQPLKTESWETHQNLACLTYLFPCTWIPESGASTTTSSAWSCEGWQKLQQQWHILVCCPFVQGSGGWAATEDTHSRSWNKDPYATREGRESGNEMQMLLLVTEIWQISTQVISWLWQERSLQSEAVSLSVESDKVRLSFFRQNPASFFKETTQDKQFHLRFKSLPFI